MVKMLWFLGKIDVEPWQHLNLNIMWELGRKEHGENVPTRMTSGWPLEGDGSVGEGTNAATALKSEEPGTSLGTSKPEKNPPRTRVCDN